MNFKKFQKNVKDMIQLRDTSAYFLSKKCNVSRNEIVLLLKGATQQTTMHVIKELAKGLKCTPGWLTRE
jgi:DNA-binding Xre family transcriptional regulator